MADQHEPTDAKVALARAIEHQTAEALETWATTGPSGLQVLHDLLRGTYRPSWPGVHPKDEVDGLAAAVGAIAAREPTAFLETFRDRAFGANLEVLIGFGWIDDPEATHRLLDAAVAADSWVVRQQAVIGLGRRRHTPAVEAALLRAIGDHEYLVRYHALTGLAAVGTAVALEPLRAFRGESDFERQLAATAVAQITARARDSRNDS